MPGHVLSGGRRGYSEPRVWRGLALSVSAALHVAFVWWWTRVPTPPHEPDEHPLEIVWLVREAREPAATPPVRPPLRLPVSSSDEAVPTRRVPTMSHLARAEPAPVLHVGADDAWAPRHADAKPPGLDGGTVRRNPLQRPQLDLMAVESRVRFMMRGGGWGTCDELKRMLQGGDAGIGATSTTRDIIARQMLETGC